eukprot:GFUD01024118.1.p1 GENE.GFUD01024118.1~~GFUD01024118.1.p1  ORF type:complete len:242 (+),score=71.52 GFUD01024118.1:64-726(+)
MCIYYNPKLNDLSDEEVLFAYEADVDNEEEEEEEEFSDEDNMPAPEEEVAGLSSLNKVMNMLGEDEVLKETWSLLCVMKKVEVFDIILNQELIEMEDMSEKGKFMAHLGAIFEEKSDGTFEEIADCRWIEEKLRSFNELVLTTLEFMCCCRSDVLKLKQMVTMTSELELDLMTEIKKARTLASEKVKEAMALVRTQFDNFSNSLKEYLKKMEVIKGMENH